MSPSYPLAGQRSRLTIAVDFEGHGSGKVLVPLVGRHFDQLCERAGVRRIRVHDLRHSCATLLYDQGVPLERIQDVLGHSSPTVTKSI